jgi:hypothetical protein
MCILGGFLCAILINTGAVGGDYIGFRYWRDPGPIANGIDGFGQCFLLAAVYYCGESKHPHGVCLVLLLSPGRRHGNACPYCCREPKPY